MTWGHPDFGGDSSVVQHRLKDVRAIHATEFAFAAILADGSAVTWGDLECTDDSPATDQLRSARQVQGNKFGARAAVLADGSVVTWGDAHYGGDSSAVQDQLQNVQQVEATGYLVLTSFVVMAGLAYLLSAKGTPKTLCDSKRTNEEKNKNKKRIKENEKKSQKN